MITSHLITISIIIEGIKIVHMLINIGYLAYKAISSMFVRKAGLEHINILIRKLIGIGRKEGRIDEIVKVKIDIDKHK